MYMYKYIQYIYIYIYIYINVYYRAPQGSAEGDLQTLMKGIRCEGDLRLLIQGHSRT